jgi:lysophospholipase L1-like esterase
MSAFALADIQEAITRMNPKVANLAIGALALGLSLGLGEIALRAVVSLPVRRVLPEVKYAPHPVRRFTLLPSQRANSYGAPVQIDDRAFRSNGHAHSGVRERILALGDSFTFGLGVEDGETWPAQLERKLSAAPGDVEVVNSGTISYGVFQELDLFRTSGLATNPRVVVHGLYWNDFMNASAPGPGARSVVDANGYLVWDQLDARGGLRSMASTAISSSALLFSLRQAAAGLRKNAEPQTDYGAAYDKFLREGLSDKEWATIEGFYRDLQALGHANGFDVVVAIMPVIDIATRPGSENHPYRVEARRRLERLGIPYADGFSVVTAAGSFLPQGPDAHLNADGYRRVADALAGVMAQRRGIPSASAPR